MGQRLAKHYMDDGVRLYHIQRRQQAVDRWRQALDKLKNAEDRFITMGYLAQAYCEVGNFREMLTFAMHQIDLANLCNDSYMKAEAYLNLARASERLSEYHKAISYARHSIQHQSMDPRTPGYAYLCMAQAYLGFSQFQMALEHYELSMQVASATTDKLLELQICVGLGSLFSQLRDLAKAVVFLQNALALLRTISLGDVQAKYRSLILYHLSVALRKNGSLVDARSAAEEGLRLSTDSGHQPIQARCLLSLGDIHQELGEKEPALMHYDSAYSMMKDMDDKMGQVHVLSSLAKAAGEAHRLDSRTCECQALQLNKKCLELSKQIGCKLSMLKCHSRLQELYSQLSDDESEDIAKKAVTALTQELEMFCNFCGQRFGNRDEALQALPCSHLFHQRCLHNHLGARASKECPKCVHAARAGHTPSRKSRAVTPHGGVPDYHNNPPQQSHHLHQPNQPSASSQQQYPPMLPISHNEQAASACRQGCGTPSHQQPPPMAQTSAASSCSGVGSSSGGGGGILSQPGDLLPPDTGGGTIKAGGMGSRHTSVSTVTSVAAMPDVFAMGSPPPATSLDHPQLPPPPSSDTTQRSASAQACHFGGNSNEPISSGGERTPVELSPAQSVETLLHQLVKPSGHHPVGGHPGGGNPGGSNPGGGNPGGGNPGGGGLFASSATTATTNTTITDV